jgi:hypothetical protein
MITNKRLLISESRDDSNRCTPYRGNLIYTTHMFPAPVHIRHSYASCRQSPIHSNLWRWPNRVGWMHCSWKNAPDSTSQPDWVARGTHFNFSPNWTIEAVINTFNICLQGPTHRSLTDIGGGYNRDDSKFPHHSPRPFQLMILCFPLRPPPGLRLTIQQSSN